MITIKQTTVEFEQEWLDLDLGGQLEAYKTANPTHRSMMPRILKTGYQALQLIHYFTAGADEVKAWTIKVSVMYVCYVCVLCVQQLMLVPLRILHCA
jgi:ribosome-binding ATPase YchF (GTP1/OBG family)